MVTVDETDFALELSTNTFTPGMYTFTITNSGDTTHALEIEGPGVEEAATDQLAPGDTGSLTVTLENGDYTVYCPVGNHADMGMTTTITVG